MVHFTKIRIKFAMCKFYMELRLVSVDGMPQEEWLSGIDMGSIPYCFTIRPVSVVSNYVVIT